MSKIVDVTIVIVDTNIIAASPWLDGKAWISLIEHGAEWGVRIVVPEVVVMEAVGVVRRLWQPDRDRLAGLPLGQFGLVDQQSAMVAAIDQASDGYEEWVLARLSEFGVDVEPVPKAEHMDIARRASEGRTPFTRNKEGKTKDGYRDTLIWLTVLAVAQANPEEEIWLVSNNFTDFGPKPPHWTGPNTGDREDCPILFHKELAEELAMHGLTERVHYVLSLERLELQIASQFAPIAGPDLEYLVSAVNMANLASKLMYTALGIDLDPATAALPVEVVGAQVVGVHEQQDGWNFSEAARRGDTGWTTRFAVDTKVDIEIVGPPWIESELTKVLRMIGRVTFSHDGEVLDLAVDSAEALPDDPDRRRRLRRGQRDDRLAKDFTEYMQDRDAQMLKDIADRMGGPDVGKIWQDRNAQMLKDIADRMGGPDVGKIWQDRNARNKTVEKDGETEPPTDTDPPPEQDDIPPSQ